MASFRRLCAPGYSVGADSYLRREEEVGVILARSTLPLQAENLQINERERKAGSRGSRWGLTSVAMAGCAERIAAMRSRNAW